LSLVENLNVLLQLSKDLFNVTGERLSVSTQYSYMIGLI
jgi:hypothetical protein